MRTFATRVLCVCLLGWPARAWADPDQGDAARAQILFDAAVKASKANDFASACPKFAASQKLDPKTTTLLNLASCYELSGRSARAWATFKEAEAAAQRFGRKDWAERAATAIRRLEPKIVRLVVHVPEEVRALRGVQIALDDQPVERTEWDEPLPVDPGGHRLTWEAPGHVKRWRSVDVTASNLEITLEPLDPEPRPPETRVVVAAPRTPPPPPSFWTPARAAGVATAGVGVVSLGVGAAFGLAASAKYDDAERLCGGAGGSPRVCLPETSGAALAARDDAAGRATVSTALFLTGGVLVAGGAALFVLGAPRRAVAIAPWPGGLVAAGRW